MKPLAAFLVLASGLLAQSPLTLWYKQPAKLWVEALPVGNGRMGAMVFGGVASERIQFNEATVWTGEPHDYAHKGAYQSLAKIRELLVEGKQKEAEDLAWREFMSDPPRQKAYQAFGDLILDFPEIDESKVTNYRRELDLDRAVATAQYDYQGVSYRREVFASYPAKAIVVHLTASQPGMLSFTARLKNAHGGTQAITSYESGIIGPVLTMSGQVENSAIRFQAQLNARLDPLPNHYRLTDHIEVFHVNSATFVLSGATNFKNFRDVTADPAIQNKANLTAIGSKNYDSLLKDHIADHQRLFHRVTIDLGTSPAAALPTDERIKAFAGGSDPQLIATLFQFGRYLMIGTSRPGGQPANLQGLWNESNNPAWDSKYTDNINTEMNYWPVEETNLSECQLPLFDALKELAISGAVTAKEHYNAGGWVLHHNFDLWRGTAPINASNHGIWQTGGAWLSTHLWEHYVFTGDKQFLKNTAYPLMKGAAEFFADTLVKDAKTGKLITGPSNSPEQGGLVMGPTMDRQIVRSLFGEVIAAARILNIDPAFRDKLTGLRAEIAPNQIGKFGQLQEWMEDVDDPKNQHRHMSHLWGVYPGSEITPYGTPDLFKAARQSLIFRGDAATGWSMGWKLNLWARFLDGEHAYKILQNLVTPASDGKPSQAGLFPNLFDAHPPFQIDGNFGATAGITEMLLQSDDPYATPTGPVQTGETAFLTLLPALPSAFATGKVTGLKARGAIDVALAWKDGKLTEATLESKDAKTVKVRYDGKEVSLQLKAGKPLRFGPALN